MLKSLSNQKTQDSNLNDVTNEIDKNNKKVFNYYLGCNYELI